MVGGIGQIGCRAAEGSMRWLSRDGVAQRIAIRIGTAQCDRFGSIFIGAECLRGGHGGIVGGGDGDGDIRLGRIDCPVIDFEYQIVTAVEIGRRCVSKIGCGTAEGPVGGVNGHGIGQAVPVRIGTAEGKGFGGVLGGGDALGIGHGGSVVGVRRVVGVNRTAPSAASVHDGHHNNNQKPVNPMYAFHFVSFSALIAPL